MAQADPYPGSEFIKVSKRSGVFGFTLNLTVQTLSGTGLLGDQVNEFYNFQTFAGRAC